jgi:osomolarity two-component system sensor histidine kinase SLN1
VDALYGDDAPVPPTPSTESGQSSSGLHPRVPSFSHGDLRFAVVFLDNQMPVMSGLDAVRRVRARGGRDFIVGVTVGRYKPSIGVSG